MSHTLAEEYLLLILDDESGKPLLDASSLHTAIAAAALTDLVYDGALEITESDGPVKKGRFARTGRAEPTDPLRLEILEKAHGRKPKDAVSAIGGMFSWSDRAKTLKEQLLERLAGEGVLEQQESKILGIFTSTRWTPGEVDVEREIRDRVRAVLVDGAEPDRHTATLISLLQATRVVRKVFPDADRTVIDQRAKNIAASDWAGTAVRQVIDEATAVMVTTYT
ncbi:GPP34 family phosphoprotein [Occultella aeris]|uniref:GPP34 family phosphoprotein n=1 Tax=Occultella aeris TaxID=2761496 RepID=A0A7M4DIT0_9MICO|nr:GPP34 family phosphoprotein [Occultella aeris]VZO36893.1 hypothetical protein HALOF300_02033 [Occultella aeris]